MALDLEKVTVRLTAGTREKLQRYFPNKKYNEAVRLVLDSFLRQMAQREGDGPTLEDLK